MTYTDIGSQGRRKGRRTPPPPAQWDGLDTEAVAEAQAQAKAPEKPKQRDPITDQADETFTWLKSCFENAEHVTDNARALARKDRDYYDSKQLTSKEMKALERRGQPPVVINRIKRKVNYMVGLEIKKRVQPKAYPRTPQHELDADGATQALRYAADQSRFKRTKTAVCKDFLIEGGPTGCYIGVKTTKTGAINVTTEFLSWSRCFADPFSERPDFSDATYKGFITWLDAKAAIRKFPEAKDVIDQTVASAASNRTLYDERPIWQKWVDTKRKLVRLIEIYWLGDQGWMCATLTEGGFVVAPHVSEFLDQEGEPECPLEFVSANVDREGNRYGEVRELIDLQDEINKRRSKSLHLLTMRQARFGRAVKDADKQSKELAKPDGKIIADKDEFEVLATGDLARGQMELLAQATIEMEGIGPNSSLQGKGPEGASGRAILANQTGGQIELEPLMDELSEWEYRCHVQMWNRIRQYWTGQMWLRVTDDERNMRWVGLNSPMTWAEYAERQGVAPEQLQQMGLDPNAPAVNPKTGEPALKNQVGVLDVDIIIDKGPDTVTLQQEQFDALSKIPGVPPDLLLEVSHLPNKDKILDRLTGKTGPGGGPPQPPPPPPEQIKAEAAAQEADKKREFDANKLVGDREIELAKIEAQHQKDMAELAIKRAELMLKDRELRIREAEFGLKSDALVIDFHNASEDRALMAHNSHLDRQMSFQMDGAQGTA